MTAGSMTPGLEQSVQDFKAREDRDPEKLNDEVKVSTPTQQPLHIEKRILNFYLF